MNLLKSYTYLTLAQINISVNIVLAKILMAVVPIYVLLALRFTIGTAMLALVCLIQQKNPLRDLHGVKLKGRDWAILFSQALCAGFLFNAFMLTGLNYTDATTAGIIASIVPAMIALLSYFILKEKLGPRRIIAICFAVFGLIMISVGKSGPELSGGSWLGEFLVLCAVFPEALFTVIAKWHEKPIDPFSMSLIVSFFNMILFIPVAIPSVKYISPAISIADISLLLIYGILGGTLFFILWYKGLQHTKASIAAMFTAVMPVSTMVLSTIFLGEHITRFDILGALMVILSIFFGSMSLKRLKFKAFLLND